MKKETEKEIIDSLRILSLEGSELALDLLLKITRDEAEKDIGGIKVSLATYNSVVDLLERSLKIKAIKVLKDVFGSKYSLLEYKVAVESIKIIPQN